jgi:hypothetical protein
MTSIWVIADFPDNGRVDRGIPQHFAFPVEYAKAKAKAALIVPRHVGRRHPHCPETATSQMIHRFAQVHVIPVQLALARTSRLPCDDATVLPKCTPVTIRRGLMQLRGKSSGCFPRIR